MSALRLGMFGGAFDPPHHAHVALARLAVQDLQLDRLHVIPTGHAWHKARDLTLPDHRLAMARLAFETLPGVTVDDRELRRAGPTYTVDTLRELQSEHPGAELFLLMGADQAAAFTSWREWQEIARLATLAVAQRPDASFTGAAPAGVRIQPLSLPAMPVSATGIRARLTAGQDITQLVPAEVAGYIARHHLYQIH